MQIRRESSDLDDFFHGHIGGMDAFARGLRNAAAIIEDGTLPGMVAERYATFNSADGSKVAAGTTNLPELFDYAVKTGEPAAVSGQQELYEIIFNEAT